MSTVAVARAESAPGLLRDLIAVTKPRITAMVVFTSAGGLWLAARSGAAPALPWPRALLAILATAMVVSGASALNCWMEREIDARMRRTRDRPVASGRLAPGIALAWGLFLGMAAVAILVFLVQPLAGLLAFVAFVSYVWIYTPMKRMSTDALLIGAIPGAMPTLIGWTAVTGRLELDGLLLYAILFVWQLPHFLAISFLCEEDYARGGHRVFAVVRGEAQTKRWAIVWSVAQLLVSILPWANGLVGWFYGLVALAAGLWFLAVAARGLRPGAGLPWALQLMKASVLYLGLIYLALIVDVFLW